MVYLFLIFLLPIQAKGVLRDCLQGSFWRGDYWPSALQALLQFQKTNAGIHTSGHTPPRYASSAAPGRRERKLVIAFIEPPCRVIHGIRLTLSPVADRPPCFYSSNEMLDFFFLLNVSFYVGIFLHFCIEAIFSFIKKKGKKKKYYGH